MSVERLHHQGTTFNLVTCKICKAVPKFEDAVKVLNEKYEYLRCVCCGKAFKQTEITVEHEVVDGVHAAKWEATEIIEDSGEKSLTIEIEGRIGWIHEKCAQRALPLWDKVSSEGEIIS